MTDEVKSPFRFDFKLLVLLFLALLFVLMWWLQNREKETLKETIRPPVYITRPEKTELRKVFRLSGYVESETMVTVLPRVSGYLTEMKVEMGDAVTQGQLLAQVEQDSYRLQMQQAEAAYLAAESTYQRVQKLYSSQATTQQNFDQVQAQYNAARSQWELAQLQLEYTRVEAPVSGVVLKKHTSEGSMAAPQLPVVTIGRLEDLVLRAQIPEGYYQFFSRNQNTMDIIIRVPALGSRPLRGKIKRVSPYISPETKNFEALCTIDAGEEPLRPGMFANAEFILEEKRNTYALPFECLVSGRTLWTVDPDAGRAQSQEFTLNFHSDEAFEVPAEWADMWFIREGQHFIRDGQEVRVLDPPEAFLPAEDEEVPEASSDIPETAEEEAAP